MQSGDCARRCCGTDGCVASLTRGRGHCLRPSSAHPPTAFHAKGPALPLPLSLSVSVDTSIPRGRNLSITSLRHVPGPRSIRARSEASAWWLMDRGDTSTVMPEAEVLLLLDERGVQVLK